MPLRWLDTATETRMGTGVALIQVALRDRLSTGAVIYANTTNAILRLYFAGLKAALSLLKVDSLVRKIVRDMKRNIIPALLANGKGVIDFSAEWTIW